MISLAKKRLLKLLKKLDEENREPTEEELTMMEEWGEEMDALHDELIKNKKLFDQEEE